jgi:hypothetical protein
MARPLATAEVVELPGTRLLRVTVGMERFRVVAVDLAAHP